MSVKCIPPYTPLLYRKTGICRVIPIFLIFAQKHRLWVLVRTASARRFLRVPTIYVLSKNKKNIEIFQLKIFNFKTSKNPCLLHGQVFVMVYSVITISTETFGLCEDWVMVNQVLFQIILF